MKRKWKHSGIFHFFYVTYWWCHCVSFCVNVSVSKVAQQVLSKDGRSRTSKKFGHLTDDTSFLQLLALSRRRRSRYMHVLPNERAFHFLFAVFSDSRGENGERESPSLVFFSVYVLRASSRLLSPPAVVNVTALSPPRPYPTTNTQKPPAGGSPLSSVHI